MLLLSGDFILNGSVQYRSKLFRKMKFAKQIKENKNVPSD
jgi:hypothetical protein